MNLIWIRCGGNRWCNLHALDLHHPHFNNLEGIYIIWHGAPNPRVVYIGQGVIKDRLETHRNDPNFTSYSSQGLYVTWASVARPSRDGVEKFLIDKWNPILCERTPNTSPIEVNSPW